ncbi:MAG: DUF4160 domain-containing protein [Clostridia bacterium]|nr:DUF4160 domain-containing protein [Clostridia bacterium]
MPTISMFYGIEIQMYYNDHLPPHFHAYYQGEEAIFSLDGTLIKGSLARRACRLVQDWAELHIQELERNWDLAREKAALEKIPPLN